MSLLKDLSMQPVPQEPVQPAQPSSSLIKELVNVQTALKASDKSDAGSTDVVNKADAAQDISFSLMRNTINANGVVTGSDITDYIERAEELNDEVETVPFGLETDDGQIVKVYVNAEQADKFEEAMKNMLGMEDDIEEAINRLTTEFDIVDVVWPRAEDVDGDGEPDPDADLELDDTLDPEDDLDFAEDEYDVVASADAGDPPEADPATGKPARSEAPADDEPEDEIDAAAAADDEENADDEEASDENSEDDDEPDPDKPKKKKKKAQPAEPASAAESKARTGKVLNENKSKENEMTIGSKFLNRVLQEAPGEDMDGVKDGFNIPLDSQARAMTAKLKLPFAKRLIAFHFMCGIPGRYLNTPDITDSVMSAADMLRKKVAIRRAFTTLYEQLAAAKGMTIPAEGVQEAKTAPEAKRLPGADQDKIMKAKDSLKAAKKALQQHLRFYDGGTGQREKTLRADIAKAEEKLKKLREGIQLDEAPKNKRGGFIQKLLESVLVELGLPGELITTTGPSVVATGVYQTAELIEQNSDLERALRLLATRLGIRGNEAQEPVPEGINRATQARAKKEGWYVLGSSGDALSGPFDSEDEARSEGKGQSGKVNIKYGKVVNMKFTPSVTEAISKELAKELDDKADGDDEVELDGVLYRRTGPKDPISSPGPWREVKQKVKEAVDVGNDEFAQAVANLVSALGIPDDVIERRRTQVVQALRQKRATIRNRAQVMTMMGRLQDILSRNTAEPGTPAGGGTATNANEDLEDKASRWTHLSGLKEARKPDAVAESLRDDLQDIVGMKTAEATRHMKKLGFEKRSAPGGGKSEAIYVGNNAATNYKQKTVYCTVNDGKIASVR